MSRRQREVLGLAAEGLTEGEIAERLGLAKCTVNGYLARARKRLGAKNTVAAVAKAIKAGLI